MKAKPSRAWLGPFKPVLSEKHLHNHKAHINNTFSPQTWGYSIQPQGPAFPAPEIQLLAAGIAL